MSDERASRAALKVLRDATNDALEEFKKVGTPGAYGEGNLTSKAAILQAAEVREHGVTLEVVAGELSAAIDRFTKASDATAGRLATWTMVLALATIGLTFATAGLVLVEWLHRAQ